MDEEKILDISWGTILKIAITFLGFYILYLIKDILIWTMFALIISVLFEPAISFLQKRKIPRVLATIFIYIGLGLVIVFIYDIGRIVYTIIENKAEPIAEQLIKAQRKKKRD